MRYQFKRPVAYARIRGGRAAPGLIGMVKFYQHSAGVIVEAQVTGLPENGTGIYGFHIHEGTACLGDMFPTTGNHYNPLGTSHPNHAGDLPPLLSYGGRAWFSVMTERFSIPDILGRTVVIHDRPDDFHTQPSGNAGDKIGCGVIRKYK